MTSKKIFVMISVTDLGHNNRKEENKMKKYTVVLPENASYNEQYYAKAMVKDLEPVLGSAMEIVTDKTAPAAAEIVFGKTNRSESRALYGALEEGTYAIRSEADSIYVAYDNYLVLIDAVAKLTELCKNGLDTCLNIVETPDHTDAHMKKEREEQIRVMSTNIVAAGDLASLKYRGEKYGVTYIDRVDVQASMILDYLPDIIGLQEIQEGTVNKIEGYMHTELMKRIGHEYTKVDFSEYVPNILHMWTPIAYRTSVWDMVEFGAATNEEILNVMHRWQWAVYRRKADGQLFIHMNLHGPHGGNEQFRNFQPVFFGLVNKKLKELMAKYPEAPCAVTGDYNQLYEWPALYNLRMDISLDTAYRIAKDTTYPEKFGSIDHIMVPTDKVEVDLYRMIDNGLLYVTSDHRPSLADLTVKK